MEEFTLKYFNQTKVFNHEVKLIDLLPDQDKKKYFCAKVNNHLHELNYTVFYDADIETYEGSVQVTRSGNLFLYEVWIHNGEYQIIEAGVDTKTNTNKDVALDDVENYSGSWSDAYNKCGSTT